MELKELPMNEASSQSNEEFIKILNSLKNGMKQQPDIDHVKRLTQSKINNPFDILLVSQDALDSEIKKQYRTLAGLIHPDKCKDRKASEAFNILETAFKEIMDPNKRNHFNQVFKEAQARVESARSKLNKSRISRGLSPLSEDTIGDEIKLEMKQIMTELEEQKQYAETLEMNRKKREKEEWELNNLKEDLLKEVEKEFEQTREKRVKNWQRFQDRITKGNKRSLNELQPPLMIKMEERPFVDEGAKYKFLGNN